MRERDSSKTKYEKEIEKLTETKTELEKHKKEAVQQIANLKADLSKFKFITKSNETFV